MANPLVVVTPDKPVLQGMGFSCETGGNWSSREKSRRYCIWIIWHRLQCHPSNEGREDLSAYEYASEGEKVIDSRRIHVAGMR